MRKPSEESLRVTHIAGKDTHPVHKTNTLPGRLDYPGYDAAMSPPRVPETPFLPLEASEGDFTSHLRQTPSLQRYTPASDWP